MTTRKEAVSQLDFQGFVFVAIQRVKHKGIFNKKRLLAGVSFMLTRLGGFGKVAGGNESRSYTTLPPGSRVAPLFTGFCRDYEL
jgi:hypothetical protein